MARSPTNLQANDQAGDVAVDANGSIVVGTAFGIGSAEFAVARYTANGQPDPTFGVNGEFQSNYGGFNFGGAVAIQGDGKILVAGSRSAAGTSVFAFIRLSDSGATDSTLRPRVNTNAVSTTRVPKPPAERPSDRVSVTRALSGGCD